MFANIMKFVVALSLSLLVLFANAGAQVCTPAPDGLISFWSGDGNALDARSRNDPTQTLGSPQFVAAEVGQGMKFDGVNDGYIVPSNSSLDIGPADSFTLEAWVRADSLGGSGSVFHTIATKEDSTAVYRLLLRDDGIYDFEIIDSANDRQVFSGTVSAGSFNHVAVVLNRATNLLTIYLNGAQQSTTDISGEGSLANTGRFFIGHKSLDSGTGAISFDGVVDELSTYNRALSASEIQAIANAGTAGKCKPVATVAPSGIVAWWPGEGNSVDMSGNGNDAVQHSGGFAPGKVGQAFSLDGVNDYVEAPDSPSLSITGQLSIETWIDPFALGTAQTIVSKYNTACPTNGTEQRTFQFCVYNGLPDQYHCVQTTTPIMAGTFTHVAGTFDPSTQDMKIYVNGVDTMASVLGGSVTVNPIFDSDTPVDIGRAFCASTENFFGGLIDELALYNRALTPGEVTSIFNAGSAGKINPLGTTAAPVSISGRVTTSAGMGISRATVKLIDRRGNSRTVLTNTFGFFAFDDVTVGRTYIIEVNSPRYKIANNTRVITLEDELSGLDFTAAGEGKF